MIFLLNIKTRNYSMITILSSKRSIILIKTSTLINSKQIQVAANIRVLFICLSDSYLELDEFEALMKCLFSFNGNSYFMSRRKLRNMFNFYKNKEVKI